MRKRNKMRGGVPGRFARFKTDHLPSGASGGARWRTGQTQHPMKLAEVSDDETQNSLSFPNPNSLKSSAPTLHTHFLPEGDFDDFPQTVETRAPP